MRLAQPAALWLLVLLPALLLLWYHAKKRRLAFLCQVGDPALLRQTPPRFPHLRNDWWCQGLVACTVMCTTLALSDPRYPLGTSHLRAGTLDVVMLLDISLSMAAEDYGTQSRLERARQAARQLLSPLQGNRVGLVTYAGVSFRQAELTDDLEALDFILKHWININAVGVGGSNLAAALTTGLDLFQRDNTGRDKLILLFSDGGTQENEEEALRTVLTKATHEGVKIVALGLGGTQPARIPQYDAEHKFTGYLEIDGHIVTSRLNEETLQHVANSTNGTYVRMTRGEEWRHLLSRADVAGKNLTQDERKVFQPFLLFALLAFAMQILLSRL
jgi:Ca-activated chloride channel homolog